MSPLYYFIYFDRIGTPCFIVDGGNTPYLLTTHPRLFYVADAHCAAFNECIARCMNQRRHAGQPVFASRKAS